MDADGAFLLAIGAADHSMSAAANTQPGECDDGENGSGTHGSASEEVEENLIKSHRRSMEPLGSGGEITSGLDLAGRVLESVNRQSSRRRQG